MPKLIAFIPQVLLVTILFTACSIKDPAEVLVLPVSPVSLDRAEGPSHKFMAQKERYEREVEMTRDPLLGYVPVERLMVAEQRAKTMQARMMDAPAFTWVERGPANIAGRTRTVLIDAGDPSNNTVFAGSVSGGLWKTSNFKTSTPEWTPVIAVSANLAITTMAQHPGNPLIMYAGTGEGFNNIDAVRGLGIYKTIDGGLTWTMLPSTTTGGANRNDFSFVQEVLVYPNGDVYASGISASFCNNGGVLRSTNGGASWTRVIGLYTGGGTCNNAFDFAGYDIAMSKDGDLYATVIDNGFSYTAPATTDTTIGKIYRSPAGLNVGNAGNWVNVTPPPLSAHGSYWRRIAIACSPTNNNRIYALLQGTGTAIGGIRVSHDAGASW
ncbi:MAG: WD40/YVTN/BNR-like repeat-containing protein, partial [Chitinophagaceae bacterium]